MVRRRVLIVAESYFPAVNGVAGSVIRVGTRLRDRGHEVLVVAPSFGRRAAEGAGPLPTTTVPSLPMPSYPEVRLALPSTARIRKVIEDYRPDVVHLASPALLGRYAATAARRSGVPSVAIFQTDLAGFARRYGFRGVEPVMWKFLRGVHEDVDRTLAPSSASARDLAAAGVPRVHRWTRGVDTQQFDPTRRSEQFRRRVAPGGELVVGYVGRLAPEKRVDLLADVARLDGVKLVVVGDGPVRRRLEQQLPGAVFTGRLSGDELGEAYASLDLFVHTGAHETFCQSVQEALASGVPAVVPEAGGPTDLVTPGRTGAFFTPDDAASLTGVVRDLRDRPVLRALMARAARPSVSMRTWPVLVEELERHYTEVIGDGEEIRARAAAASKARFKRSDRTAVAQHG